VLQLNKSVDVVTMALKALLRRANALKCIEDYVSTKSDLKLALSINPNDGSIKKRKEHFWMWPRVHSKISRCRS